MMKKYVRTDNFILRKFADDTLLFPIGAMADHIQGTILLNELSQHVWELLKAPKTFNEIVEDITINYDVSVQEAEMDLNELLSQFEHFSVIQTMSSVDR